MENKVYSFSTDDAVKHGVDAAILLHNIRYWLDHARAHGENEYDGYFWTYATASKLTSIFPFWSSNKIQKMIKKLEEDGVLISSSYSKSSFDRTKWYSMPDFSSQPNGGFRVSQTADSLYSKYNSNTDVQQDDKKEKISYEEIRNIYNDNLTNAPKVQSMTDSRKKLVKKLFDQFELTPDKFGNYLSYINSHPDMQWAFEKRPKNDGTGQFWRAQGFEYFLSEKCFLKAKEEL